MYYVSKHAFLRLGQLWANPLFLPKRPEVSDVCDYVKLKR
jgi:hypothetical protein